MLARSKLYLVNRHVMLVHQGCSMNLQDKHNAHNAQQGQLATQQEQYNAQTARQDKSQPAQDSQHV